MPARPGGFPLPRLLVALVLTAGLLAPPSAGALTAAPAGEVTRGTSATAAHRIAGPDRIATAAALAEESFPASSEQVYLARADVLADALAAGVLPSGPVLLVPPCGPVPSVVSEQIARLQPRAVTALGGTVAVCDELLSEAAGGRPTNRLAGANRIETAVAVSRAAFPRDAREVYLARSDEAPDAVAAGSLTAGPILLVPSSGPPPAAVLAEVARLAPSRVVALGGTAAISEATASEMAGERPLIRLAGPDRVATASAIAGYRFGIAPGESAPETAEARSAYLARGDVFADAVAAGSLTDGPVLLTPTCGPLPAPVAAELERLRPSRVVALGGLVAVCDDVLRAAVQAADLPLAVPEETVVLDEPQLSTLVQSDDGGRLTFAADPGLEPGDVVVAAGSPAEPDGLLAEVTAIEQRGQSTSVVTEPAAVTDAITSGFGAEREPLLLTSEVPTGVPGVSLGPVRQADSRTGAAAGTAGIRWAFSEDAVLFDADGDRSTTWDQVLATGEVVLSGEMAAALEVGPRDLRPTVRRFAFTLELREEKDLQVHWGVSLSRGAALTFGPYPLPAFVIPVGPVTVPVKPELVLTLSAEGQVSAAVTFSAEQTYTSRVGAEYRDGAGWSPIGSAARSGASTGPGLGADARATLTATVRVPFKLGGVAGPALEADAYVRGDASLTPVDWSLTAGVRGRAGFDVSFPVLGPVRSLTTRDVLSREWLLAEHRPSAGGVTHEQLSSASVPSLCGHPAGRLTGGRLPGLDPIEQGEVYLADSLVGDLDGDGRDEGIAVLGCTLGGTAVAWSIHVYTAGMAYVGRADIEGGRQTLAPSRVALTDVRIVDGTLEVTALDIDADDPMCCPSVFLSRRFDLAAGALVPLPPAPPRATDALTSDGWGSLRIGMGYGEVARVTGWPTDLESLQEDEVDADCTYLVWQDAPAGFGAQGGSGRLQSLWAFAAGARTPVGVGVGSSESAVLAAYGAAATRVDNVYSDIDDIVVPAADGRVTRFILDAESLVVREFSVGERDSALSPEGCA